MGRPVPYRPVQKNVPSFENPMPSTQITKILWKIQILAPALVPAYFPKVYRLSARAKSKLAGTLHKSAILEGHIIVKT